MRVLMTTDAVGGVFSYSTDLALRLAAHDVEVSLAVLGPRLGRDQRGILQGIPRLEVHECDSALEWMDDPWSDIDATGHFLVELARRTRPDVVHLNDYSHAVHDFGAPKLVVAHSSVVGWWRAVCGEQPPPFLDEYARRVAAGLAAADLVIAPTRAMLGALASDHGFTGRSAVVANGIDLRKVRVAEKRPYFAAAGRLWDRAKNLGLLLEVGPKLPWPLCVAGEGGELETDRNVQLLGRLPRAEVGRLLGAASAFLHPARYEPFGLAPLEAACAGCALVLGDIESLREVWGTAALYVPTSDPEALLEAASALAKDGRLLATMAERAREHAARYSLAITAKCYVAVYRALAARSAPATARAADAEGTAA